MSTVAASSRPATGTPLTPITLITLGQVIFGPWSDRAGRMRPLVIGLVVYVVASVAAALAPKIAILVLARLFQAPSPSRWAC